jgi:hypothetical protein
VEGRLIVEHLDDETLVYDTDRNEAHALSGAVAAAFLAAEDEVSRREVLRKLALTGAAVAGTGALVRTVIAPTPAQAQSPVQCGAVMCQAGAQCCTTGPQPFCAVPTGTCCGSAVCLPGIAGPCCQGICCLVGQICCGTICATPAACAASDCALKRHLAPVGPQDVLAALGL